MSLKLAARLVRIQALKIADLQENDTATHEENLSAILPPEVIAIIFHAHRVAGAGVFIMYPNTGTIATNMPPSGIVTLPIKNTILKWANSVANDDWDIYLHGYFVEKRTR